MFVGWWLLFYIASHIVIALPTIETAIALSVLKAFRYHFHELERVITIAIAIVGNSIIIKGAI